MSNREIVSEKELTGDNVDKMNGASTRQMWRSAQIIVDLTIIQSTTIVPLDPSFQCQYKNKKDLP